MYQIFDATRKFSLICCLAFIFLIVGCSDDGMPSRSIISPAFSSDEHPWDSNESLVLETPTKIIPEKLENLPPVINLICCSELYPGPGDIVSLEVEASDPDGDQLEYCFLTKNGCINSKGCNASWELPDVEGNFKVSITVNDDIHEVVKSFEIQVREHHNLHYDL